MPALAGVDDLLPRIAELLGLEVDALDGVLEDELAVLADPELDDAVVAGDDVVELAADLLHVLRDAAAEVPHGLAHHVSWRRCKSMLGY